MTIGCIKRFDPTPQQDLVRVEVDTPRLYIGQRGAFCGKVVAVQNQQGKTAIATVRNSTAARVCSGQPRAANFADVDSFLDPVDFRGQLVTVVGPIASTVDGKNRQAINLC